MSFKAVAWTLLAAMALAGILLLNYWASYQPLTGCGKMPTQAEAYATTRLHVVDMRRHGLESVVWTSVARAPC